MEVRYEENWRLKQGCDYSHDAIKLLEKVFTQQLQPIYLPPLFTVTWFTTVAVTACSMCMSPYLHVCTTNIQVLLAKAPTQA